MRGLIVKALSGFYYVDCEGEIVCCKPRGKFRYEKVTPLVGDWVTIAPTEPGKGRLDQIAPRKNEFQRPSVANMDQMIIVAAQAIPVTDPFLIDRVAAIAELKSCEPVLVINKCDLESGAALEQCYQSAGIKTFRVSAKTGEGMDALRECLRGKISVFTGNSGVGKSSILNALDPRFQIETGEISKKLGRGKHTTRHVELFRLANNAVIADTPGFAAFDTEVPELLNKERLAYGFREFVPYIDQCRFVGCAHIKEKGCAVCEAVKAGAINKSRHDSYIRLYAAAKEHKAWETKEKKL